MKRILIALLLFLITSSVFALSTDISIDYSLCLPQKSSVISATGAIAMDFTGNFYAGSYLGLGYSYRYYNEGGSEAQLYGPALKLGLLTGYNLDDLSMELSAGVKAIYSQFPIVLWYSAGINTAYRITDDMEAFIYLGGLYWENDISIETSVGVRF